MQDAQSGSVSAELENYIMEKAMGLSKKGSSGVVTVLGAVAEIERENISVQTMAGRRQKAREGLWNGGQAPYGYKLEYKDGSKTGALKIDDEEAANVKLIYQKYLDGLGVNGTAKWMNEHGYRKKSRQNSTLELFSGHFVTICLDNPVYMGMIAYGRRGHEVIEGTRDQTKVVRKPKDSYTLYEGKHEAIIPKDTWYQVQAKRALTKDCNKKIYDTDHYHVLSGVLRCPLCGGRCTGQYQGTGGRTALSIRTSGITGASIRCPLTGITARIQSLSLRTR